MSFGVAVGVRAPAEHSGPRGVAATVTVRTTAPCPRWEACTGSVHVRVSPISRQESPGLQTALAVETDQPEERELCSERTPHSDIPSAYAVRCQHGPSTFGPSDFSQCLHHP